VTSIDIQIDREVNAWIKNFLRWFGDSLNSITHDLILEKEKRGWNLELVQKMRVAFNKFEKQKVFAAGMMTTAGRKWLRILFDVICLTADAEGEFTIDRWKKMVKILKKEGLLDIS